LSKSSRRLQFVLALVEDHFVALEVLDVCEVNGPKEGEAGNEEHTIFLRDEREVHCLWGEISEHSTRWHWRTHPDQRPNGHRYAVGRQELRLHFNERLCS
jgi:hypothetical protein